MATVIRLAQETDAEPMLAIYAPPGPEAELRRTDGVIIEPPRR